MQVLEILVAFCFMFIWHGTMAYRTDIDSAGEEAFCEYRKHLTFKPTATCCANKVIKPSLNIDKHWQACVSEVGGKSGTVEGIGWDIYACILKKESGKDKLSLQEFANLITMNYPEDIKSQINSEIKAQTIPGTSLSNYGWLEKIRVTYYDIEKEICEGMPSESKSYGKIEMCSSWKEQDHRNGMCCKTSYPVDIRYNSVFDVGEENVEKCRSELHNALTSNMMNATEMMENALLDMCDVACFSNTLNNIMGKREYWNLILEEFFGILPNFLNPMKQGVQEFLLQNDTFNLNATIQDIEYFKFADVIPSDSHTERTMNTLTWVHLGSNKTGENFKYEFMGRKFHRGILHVPVQCSIYKQVASQAEHYIFQTCKPEDVTEAPMPAETAEEPKPEPEPVEPKPESTATDNTVTEAAA